VVALQNAGVTPVLLKGPVLARWLYGPDELRPYGDVDLLVAPDEHARAEGGLRALGFRRVRRDYESARRIEHDSAWVRGDADVIDLHITLPRLRGVSPEVAWRHLGPLTVEDDLPAPGARVRVLAEVPRALLVALHAAHHLGYGEVAVQPLEDLRRALARLPAPLWIEVAELAATLRARPQLARGLHALPDGAALAARLGLPAPSSERAEAAGFERLQAAGGPAARARLIARALVPTPSYLRWSSPLARRGRVGLALAYLGRPLVMAARAPRAYLVFRRVRRTT
jgi:hypothetical protein